MRLSNRGDTIVEVMIAIVVLGASLAGAFAITNASKKTTTANSERYQAQLLANSQAEQLKVEYNDVITMNPTGGRGTFSSTYTSGCFSQDASTLTYTWNSGTTCTTGDVEYVISINRINTGAGGISPITYRITVEWPSIKGSGNDMIEVIYGV